MNKRKQPPQLVLLYDSEGGRVLLVRATQPDEAHRLATEYAQSEGLQVLDSAADIPIRLYRAIPTSPEAHTINGWDCDLECSMHYIPTRVKQGAFSPALVAVRWAE